MRTGALLYPQNRLQPLVELVLLRVRLEVDGHRHVALRSFPLNLERVRLLLGVPRPGDHVLRGVVGLVELYLHLLDEGGERPFLVAEQLALNIEVPLLVDQLGIDDYAEGFFKIVVWLDEGLLQVDSLVFDHLVDSALVSNRIGLTTYLIKEFKMLIWGQS